MTPLTFDVPGGPLHALRFGTGERTVLAVHGISASAMAWAAVAAALPADWSLVALDLRGRGASRDLPGPYGLATHADDVATAATALGGPVALAGHSMGAYVAALAASRRPELFTTLTLVDGGVPLVLPGGVDPDEVLAATLGPALERLHTTYPSVEAYLDFYRAHPALGPSWDETIADYVRYDVLETPAGVRSRALEEAVRADGRDLLVSADVLDAALRAVPVPASLLVAPAGMFGQPPGLLPAEAVQRYDDELAGLRVETVPGTNHYTILFDPAAARRVAEEVSR
ncbi:alpha/beta hydrolase [Nocardioides sp. KIGAM211]|uniref:Alpha/beta hydrolase n=1 Tax=Nocardioides luti TaxID=2761101 RepID=A0A7X0RLG5_9ACTN|nr:alpha/beta hydrolase [Nocardioides luti]MBB6629254.1 alpha/beta hydrolase [Nocardioides luti]